MSFSITSLLKQSASAKASGVVGATEASGAEGGDGFEGVFREASEAVEPRTPKGNAHQESANASAPVAETTGAEAADGQTTQESDQQEAGAKDQDAQNADDSEGSERGETSDGDEGREGTSEGDDGEASNGENDSEAADAAKLAEDASVLTPAGLNNGVLQNALTGGTGNGAAGQEMMSGEQLAGLQQMAEGDGEEEEPLLGESAKSEGEALGAALSAMIEGEVEETEGLDAPTDDIDSLTLSNASMMESTQGESGGGAESETLVATDSANAQTQGEGGSPEPDRQAAVELQAASAKGFAEEMPAEGSDKSTEKVGTAGPSAEGPTVEGRVVVETEASVNRVPIVETTTASAAVNEAGAAGGANIVEDSDEEDVRVTQQAIRAVRSVVAQGGGSVTLRLNPQELGAIKVQLDLTQNTVRAQFTATNDSVRNILNQQMGTLRVALEGQGLNVESLSASSSSSNTQQGATGQESSSTEEGRSKGTFTGQGSGGEGEGAEGEESSEFERELLDLVG